MVSVKPGPFKKPEEINPAYHPIVEATPVCIVYADGSTRCWGSVEKLRELLRPAYEKARVLAPGKARRPEEIVPDDAMERVESAAKEIAKLVVEHRDALPVIEEIEKKYNLYIIYARNDKNGRYIVTIP